jgi:hypothetical protein
MSLTADSTREELGFIQSGGGSIGYGRCKAGVCGERSSFHRLQRCEGRLPDGEAIELPFDFTEVKTFEIVKRVLLPSAPPQPLEATGRV